MTSGCYIGSVNSRIIISGSESHFDKIIFFIYGQWQWQMQWHSKHWQHWQHWQLQQRRNEILVIIHSGNSSITISGSSIALTALEAFPKAEQVLVIIGRAIAASPSVVVESL